MELWGLNCCGIKELSGLSQYPDNPADAMQNIGRMIYISTSNHYIGKHFRYIVFSQAGKNSHYGEVFAKYILDNNLGSLVETDWHVNPNSKNQLKVWVWTTDHHALDTWWKENDGSRGKGKKTAVVPTLSAVPPPPSGRVAGAPGPVPTIEGPRVIGTGGNSSSG